MRQFSTEKTRKLLADRFMTITELAKQSDVSLVTTMRVVNGRQNPSLKTINKFCKALKCKPQEITSEVNENE